MFARPSSGMYSPESSDGKTRVFENEYVIFFKGEKLKCKLTTEWVGSELVEGAQGNNDVVNITLHFFLKDIRPMLPPAMNHSIAVS